MIDRYGIYWVRLDPAEGREVKKVRPCVVVSPGSMHRTGMCVVCAMTTKLHPTWAHRIQINSKAGVSEIMADQIRAVSITRFGKQIDKLSAADAEKLRELLTRLYGTV